MRARDARNRDVCEVVSVSLSPPGIEVRNVQRIPEQLYTAGSTNCPPFLLKSSQSAPGVSFSSALHLSMYVPDEVIVGLAKRSTGHAYLPSVKIGLASSGISSPHL